MTHERAKSRTHATAPSYRRSQRDYLKHQQRLTKLERLRQRRCARSPQP
jgi:hypothetical protein